MADEPHDMPGSSGDEENVDAGPEEEEEEESAAWLRESWQSNLATLDLILNPSLSLHAVMSAVNAFATRIVTFRPPKRPRITTAVVNRFFDEEYLARIQAQEARERSLWQRYKHFGCIVALVFLVVFILGLIILIVYCYLNPTSPKLEVVTVEFNYNIMTDVDASTIQAQQAAGKGDYFAAVYNFSITYTVEFRNPNKKVDLFVHSLELKPFYYGFQLGRGSAPPFKQPRRSSSLLRITTVENALKVPLRENYSIKRDLMRQSIDFVVEMKLIARMSTVFGLMSPLFRSSVNCDITRLVFAPLRR